MEKKSFTDNTIGELIGGAKGILKSMVEKFVNEALCNVSIDSCYTHFPLIRNLVNS